MADEIQKRVFISYSWASSETIDKVKNLAKSLVSDGVDVILDKWSLKPGQDKFAFMEKMVSDETIDRVLMILDEGYMEKANNRDGGVGTETQIITPKLYSTVSETKFLPVVIEKDENNKPYLPVFVESRLFIDLSGTEVAYQKQYEVLLREIYEMPEETKPILGKVPEFLKKEALDTFEVNRKAKVIEAALESNPQRLTYLIKDFFDQLVEESENFIIKNSEYPIDGQMIYDKIVELLPVREAFESVIVTQLQSQNIDETMWVEFFEDAYNEINLLSKSGKIGWTSQLESYKFLIHELFLLLISKLIVYKKWDELSTILNYSYEFTGHYNNQDTFSEFRTYLDTLETFGLKRSERLGSVSAGLLHDRVKSKKELRSILEADIFLYHIKNINGQYDMWFPETYLQLGDEKKLRIFTNMKSERYLNFMLKIFNVDKNKFLKYVDEDERKSGYNTGYGLFRQIPIIKDSITIEKIGILK